MTNTIVIGKQKKKNRLTPIVFDKFLTGDGRFFTCNAPPPEFKFIELICMDYYSVGVDLMFAYDNPDNRQAGFLILGKWNDGVVE
jgi:hypothetical protein